MLFNMSLANKLIQKFCIVCGSPTEFKIPDGDNKERAVCTVCGHIHYQNPKVVSGCILEWEDKIVLCKRATEPRSGYWTLPAGFLENNETVATSFDKAEEEIKKVKKHFNLEAAKDDLAKINERLRLPPCTFENVELDMFKEEKALYEFVFLEAQDIIKDAFKNTQSLNSKNMVILECLLRARQCMIWPQMYLNGVGMKNGTKPTKWEGRSNKMETLFRMIQEHPKEKSLVFCQFRGEMNYIQSQLDCPVFRIDGSVPKEERVRQINAFKSAALGAVFIIQIKSGGQGLNLQEATRVYITAPSWNPATELQAIGRAHRTGQTQVVHVKKLIYKECPRFVSVEEEILALQGHKSIVCSEVLNDDRVKTQIPVNRTSAKISILDIKNIFRA